MTITLFELFVVITMAFMLGMICAFVIVLDNRKRESPPKVHFVERRRH